MLIDTHAHLNFNAYKNDAKEVIKRALENKIWMINVGSQYTTSKRTLSIAKEYPKGVFAAVGLHPIHLNTGIFKVKIDKEEVEFETREESFAYQKYKELAKDPKVVAIGEIGLDYYYKPKTKKKLSLFKEKQREVLREQIKLAQERGLPVIFHCRMAHKDLIEELKKIKGTIRGVIHCFTGDWEEAKSYLEMGFYLGFNGIIFKLKNLKDIIKKAPLERIILETDCPYLTPPPKEGRNEPLFVKYIGKRIAEIKNLSFEKMSEITTKNAQKLFKIPPPCGGEGKTS